MKKYVNYLFRVIRANTKKPNSNSVLFNPKHGFQFYQKNIPNR